MAQTTILDGKRQRGVARPLVDAAPAGAVVTIRPPKRSHDQNAKLRAMISDMSRAMPECHRHTPEVWKALFMAARDHSVRFENGLHGAQPFPVGFRSSRLADCPGADLLR